MYALSAGGIRGLVIMVRQEPPFSVSSSSWSNDPVHEVPPGKDDAPPLGFEEVRLRSGSVTEIVWICANQRDETVTCGIAPAGKKGCVLRACLTT
jgi:hypothetical protein